MTSEDQALEKSTVIIDPDGTESVSPEIVNELDAIFDNLPGGWVDTVALASLLLKLTGRAERK